MRGDASACEDGGGSPAAVEVVRQAVHRLFIGTPEGGLRKEDEKKCRELAGILARLGRIKEGAHVVDAAAGKASVGLVAAELLPVGRLTVIERDARRVVACRAASTRLRRSVVVEVHEADVSAVEAWPVRPDVVLALHACGGATDLVIDGAIRAGARRILAAPCCYGGSVRFRLRAFAVLAKMGFVADDVLRRRMAASLVDMERKLRLEAAGYETDIEEFVAPTVTPHNIVLCGRRTTSTVRIARARARLEALRAALREESPAP